MTPSYPEQAVAVLFSGGDAPGMNAFLRAIVRLGLNREKIAVLGVRDGYRGLVRTARAVNGDAAALMRLKNAIASHPGRADLRAFNETFVFLATMTALALLASWKMAEPVAATAKE